MATTYLNQLETIFTNQESITLKEYLQLISNVNNELGNSTSPCIKNLKIFKSDYDLTNSVIKSFRIVKK